MDPKDYEDRMDRYAQKVTDAVSDGVKRVEEAFEKGKENLRQDIKGAQGIEGIKGSPRMGLLLVGVGVVWLLLSLGILQHPIFPIIVVAVGLYYIVRSRRSAGQAARSAAADEAGPSSGDSTTSRSGRSTRSRTTPPPAGD
jgi:predicted lipid-binding transport protein (Tim44 family)